MTFCSRHSRVYTLPVSNDCWILLLHALHSMRSDRRHVALFYYFTMDTYKKLNDWEIEALFEIAGYGGLTDIENIFDDEYVWKRVLFKCTDPNSNITSIMDIVGVFFLNN